MQMSYFQQSTSDTKSEAMWWPMFLVGRFLMFSAEALFFGHTCGNPQHVTSHPGRTIHCNPRPVRPEESHTDSSMAEVLSRLRQALGKSHNTLLPVITYSLCHTVSHRFPNIQIDITCWACLRARPSCYVLHDIRRKPGGTQNMLWLGARCSSQR
jgi:hypothetical protein